jgi:hypothetical protein
MRTTTLLDDEVLKLATPPPKLTGISLDKSDSDLLHGALETSTPTEPKNGLVIFKLPANSRMVTTEHARKIEALIE